MLIHNKRNHLKTKESHIRDFLLVTFQRKLTPTIITERILTFRIHYDHDVVFGVAEIWESSSSKSLALWTAFFYFKIVCVIIWIFSQERVNYKWAVSDGWGSEYLRWQNILKQFNLSKSLFSITGLLIKKLFKEWPQRTGLNSSREEWPTKARSALRNFMLLIYVWAQSSDALTWRLVQTKRSLKVNFKVNIKQ